MSKRNKVFISYSHQDASWLLRLRVHLKPLEREYEIEGWDDTKIKPGSKWRQEIQKALSEAKIAILLVSADFLASDFIVTNELPPLLKAAEEDGAIILPVIVSPSRFLKTSLSQFQAVNDPAKSLIKLSKGEQEDVFVDVAEQIESAFDKLPKTDPINPELFKPKTEAAERAGRQTLDGASLIIYYEDAREEAKQIWSFLVSEGMSLNKFEAGLGSAGPRTIIYHPSAKEAATWIKENVKALQSFKLEVIDPRDTFRGVIINLW